jgi:hypothetical protein
MSIDQPQHHFRAVAAPSTYIFFGGLEAFALFGTAYVAVHTRLTLVDVLTLLGFPTTLIVWVYAFRLEISNGVLSYRTLFRGTRSIALSSIASARTAITPQAPLGPFFRLTIYPSRDARTRPIVINMKVFSIEDVNRLIDILGPKFHGARHFSVFRRKSSR